jgi:hypothetical protein
LENIENCNLQHNAVEGEELVKENK